MRVDHVVFDLDGTLIDSASSILASMRAAFAEAGIVPSKPLTSNLIGPPLAQALGSVLPATATADALPELIKNFKHYYDESGYRQASVYTGIPQMLQVLAGLPLRLYIATNKRILPARRIVENLGWEQYFVGVYALDLFSPALTDKSTMLKRLREILAGESGAAPIYIGDRAEDAQAAQAGEMPFYWASWGYSGEEVQVAPGHILHTPADLVRIVMQP